MGQQRTARAALAGPALEGGQVDPALGGDLGAGRAAIDGGQGRLA
jgi:hypothetical protein